MAELVDALDLGSSSIRSGGSNPPFRTGANEACYSEGVASVELRLFRHNSQSTKDRLKVFEEGEDR